jgi:hypothetical protein
MNLNLWENSVHLGTYFTINEVEVRIEQGKKILNENELSISEERVVKECLKILREKVLSVSPVDYICYRQNIAEGSCSICIDNTSQKQGCSCCGDPETELKCGHKFHKFCIDKWIFVKEKRTCPVCRGNIELLREKVLPFEISFKRKHSVT